MSPSPSEHARSRSKATETRSPCAASTDWRRATRDAHDCPARAHAFFRLMNDEDACLDVRHVSTVLYGAEHAESALQPNAELDVEAAKAVVDYVAEHATDLIDAGAFGPGMYDVQGARGGARGKVLGDAQPAKRDRNGSY